VNRELFRRAAQLATEYLETLPERHVGARGTREELLAALGGPLPERGEDPVAALERFARAMDPGLIASAGPRYFGFVTGAGLPAAMAADWLASAWNQNVSLNALSPAGAAAEEVAIGWLLELLGLPAGVALAAYAAITLCVLLAALACWRARGPLALRYSALLLATVLIDPHMYAYDLVLLVPAYMLVWDWVLGEPDRRVADVVPRAPWTWLRRQSFNSAFQWLLYACYFSPLLASIADATRVQLSVPLMTLLGATIFGVLARQD